MEGPQPQFKKSPERTLIGMRTTMTLAEDRTANLWKAFMSRHTEVEGVIDQGKFSVQVYASSFQSTPFTPFTVFEKWATMEVKEGSIPPSGMEVLKIPAGRWAVFLYKGSVRDFHKFANYIFASWLPQSGEQLDNRPHYEYMSRDYLGPNHPDSEEEVWIPIK